jgi:dienelactone hydrolase
LRFDYHGTGNSAGDDSDPDRVAAWIANVREACVRARAETDRTRVCLVGVRLGATLAALATRQVAVEDLVLWNPCISGKNYVREMQAIAMSVEDAESHADGLLESAGYVITADTLEALRRIDLKRTPPVASRVLVLSRDDAAPPTAFCEALAAAHLPVQLVPFAGWQEMVAEHLYTVVPDAALAGIVEWAAAGALPLSQSPPASRLVPHTSCLQLDVPGETGPVRVVEEICAFGEENHLFGVLTRPMGEPTRPAVVMFNAGCVHNVGPNRLSVTLARALAAEGFASLRFDLEGIGDSILRRPGRENHPYPEGATEDAHAAIRYLREAHGYKRFIALGLCSGAHTAFHAGLKFAEDLQDLILINPYAFYWKEGMSLDVVTKLADAKSYKKSMRDPSRWLKLLRGDVNVRRLLDVAISQPAHFAKSYYGVLCEHLAPSKAPPLARDLRRLFEMKRSVTVLMAEGEPGADIIMAEAKHTAKQGLKAGHLRLETIEGGDHTFTQARTRRALVQRVAERLRQRLSGPLAT